MRHWINSLVVYSGNVGFIFPESGFIYTTEVTWGFSFIQKQQVSCKQRVHHSSHGKTAGKDNSFIKEAKTKFWSYEDIFTLNSEIQESHLESLDGLLVGESLERLSVYFQDLISCTERLSSKWDKQVKGKCEWRDERWWSRFWKPAP